GSYVLGCDGGRSQVRKQSSIEFKGFTWPERFLVLSTPFDFEENRGMCFRNYVADPDEWCNCFKVASDGPPGLWRVVFPADPEASEEQLLSDQFVQDKLQSFFPLDQDYNIVHRNLYNVHQRVAATFRDRRVLLAGDSCHINNSIGGMGLNGGLQDGMSLTDKLAACLEGREEESILDLYDLQRRTFAVEFVQEQTIQNKKRLEIRDAESRTLMLNNLRETANDPVRARKFLLKASMLEALRRSEKLSLN
ncbi:MAG: FAD-dependent monooxygenase, partial [Methyloligellaceae bacterium]